jgi:hypothetical protein
MLFGSDLREALPWLTMAEGRRVWWILQPFWLGRLRNWIKPAAG